MPNKTCSHLDQIKEVLPKTPQGCEECLKIGSPWVELRLCQSCGHVGCCDSSKNRHARAHFKETAHPIIRPLNNPQAWTWCYVDNDYA